MLKILSFIDGPGLLPHFGVVDSTAVSNSVQIVCWTLKPLFITPKEGIISWPPIPNTKC